MASGEHLGKRSSKHRNSDEETSKRHKHRHHHHHRDRRRQKQDEGSENGQTEEVAVVVPKADYVAEEGEILDRERERERYREKERKRKRDRERYTSGEEDNYRHNHQKLDNKEYKGILRKTDEQKINTYKIDHSQRDQVNEQEEYCDTVVIQLSKQEEEDVNRIKVESRRQRQAILDKYRTQHELKSQETKSSDELLSVPIAQMVPPGSGTMGQGTSKSERSSDMFCDDDIFGDSPAGVRKQGKRDGLKIQRSGLHDNWDDAEGYYSYRFGEVLEGRYEVIAAHGKGVFSNVVRAKDLKAGSGDLKEVAIKIIRSNDTMYKAGRKEVIILKKLVGADQQDRRHCVRFLSSFKYRNHPCLVFESLDMNLREVLKKSGHDNGLKLKPVRAYAKQLLIALKHLKNCGVLHSDIKPDNMLVNKEKNVLKLSDFGNAMFAGQNEITPYLVSRFYRAPEIILGLPYDHPIDIWSVGCCLYELFTGKVLFPGPSNNDMLRLHMELKGPFPKRMLRKGAFVDQHFDRYLNFLATKEDPVTKKAIRRLILSTKPKDFGTVIPRTAGEDPKLLANFEDLLEKMFVLDPDKRITVSQALSHPFIAESEEVDFLTRA